jgi:filamentous hemagglutinin family protein
MVWPQVCHETPISQAGFGSLSEDWGILSLVLDQQHLSSLHHKSMRFNQASAVVSIVGLLLLTVTPAIAQQINADGSLGTTVTSGNGLDFTITNGSAASGNLFHSFQSFSVPAGGSATFDLVNTPNVSTIFSRVTGGSASTIDGLITTTNATSPVSLFLLNPNGIMFGPTAKLDLTGSLVLSTAQQINFADGQIFSATNPTSLLTISVPVGLGFGPTPGKIAIGEKDGAIAQLFLPTQQSLLLAGNNVELQNSLIGVPSGRLDVVGVAGAGTVGLTQSEGVLKLQPSPSLPLANVTFNGTTEGDTKVFVSGVPGGSIGITAQNLLVQRTWLENRIIGQGSLDVPSGNIDINVADQFQQYGGYITTRINAGGLGQAGNVNVKTGSLTMTYGAQMSASLSGKGHAGDINVNATESVYLAGYDAEGYSTILSSSLRRTGVGNAGTITVNSPQIYVGGGAVITGPAQGKGNGANIILNTNTLDVVGGGQVYTSTERSGNAGTIRINARNRVTIAGFDPTYDNNLENAVAIGSSSGLLASTSSNSSGNGGSIQIRTGDLSLRDRGQINASTVGSGNAGQVGIQASNSIVLDNKAEITTLSLGSGNGGTIDLTTKLLRIKNSTINTQTASGNGGDIFLNVANATLLRDRSLLSTEARSSGNGGDIWIRSPFIVGLENSDIIANAFAGRGGNIGLTTNGILGLAYRDGVTSDNDITASSTFGVNGTVQISNVNVDVDSGLVTLPAEPLDGSRNIAKDCKSQQDSRFVVTGRGGIPPQPNDVLSSDRPWVDFQVMPRSSRVAQGVPISSFSEATTWQTSSQGETQLIAQVARGNQAQATCALVQVKSK